MASPFRLEAYKLVRGRGFVLSFAALVGFIGLMLWGFISYAQLKTGGQAAQQFRFTYESKSYFNGLTFALYSVLFGFHILVPIFVAMSAGAQVAGEAQKGTLRMMCLRPVSRATIVLSKFGVTALHTFLLAGFFVALNLLVGLVLVGWGDLKLYPGPLNLVSEPGRIVQAEALRRFLYAGLAGGWSLLTLAALGTLLSVVVETPVVAVISTVALYLMLLTVGRIDLFEHLRPYLFTSDMEGWRKVFQPELPWREVARAGLRCGAYASGMLLLAVAAFERRDLTV